ncbi:tetratricopeptide repeat protein [Glaciecola sp. 2405UD65-10]|uniref:tetratricopeptide repeat protein n=1 Tax=Glaciecola sp. 2405UD65-10 TaxID=3397244 RepID=UPI003B59D75B
MIISLFLVHAGVPVQAYGQYTEEMVLSFSVDGITFKEDFNLLHKDLVKAGFEGGRPSNKLMHNYKRKTLNTAGKQSNYSVEVVLHKDGTVKRIVFNIPNNNALKTNLETLNINTHFQNNDLCKEGSNPRVLCELEFIENGHILKFIAQLFGKKRRYRLVRADEALTGGGGSDQGQTSNDDTPPETPPQGTGAVSTSQSQTPEEEELLETEPSGNSEPQTDESSSNEPSSSAPSPDQLSDAIADLFTQAQLEQLDGNMEGDAQDSVEGSGQENSQEMPNEGEQGEGSQGESLLEMAQNGDAQAQFELAMQHESLSTNSASHAQAAMDYYEMAAEQGHAGAQFQLANMLAANEGMTDQVFDLLEEAAANNHAGAAFMLGMQHLLGNATEQNDGEALQYFQQAATQNYVPAMEALALMYEHGLGVEPNIQMANKLRADAAKIEAQEGDQEGMYGNSNFDIDLPITSNVLPF